MSSTHEVLPYSVSSGSAFNAFNKLQGTKNYVTWMNNMCTVLMSLCQWDVVDGTDQAPTPADKNSPTPTETKEMAVWKVRSILAFMEISFQVADSAKTILGGTRNPKVTWDLLAKQFSAKQEGLQSTLISKLQLAMWNGIGSIHTHHNYMVKLQCQLADASMQLSDQSFLSHFIESLPPSLDLFITLYEDSNHDIDFLCDKLMESVKGDLAWSEVARRGPTSSNTIQG
jgi:hypothetical protein